MPKTFLISIFISYTSFPLFYIIIHLFYEFFNQKRKEDENAHKIE